MCRIFHSQLIHFSHNTVRTTVIFHYFSLYLSLNNKYYRILELNEYYVRVNKGESFEDNHIVVFRLSLFFNCIAFRKSMILLMLVGSPVQCFMEVNLQNRVWVCFPYSSYCSGRLCVWPLQVVFRFGHEVFTGQPCVTSYSRNIFIITPCRLDSGKLGHSRAMVFFRSVVLVGLVEN